MIVPLPTNIDATGEAQRFAAQADRALLQGETQEARALHDKAGQVYEADVANRRKRSEKDALRYLAATQYYLGGHYEKALDLCRKIQADMLPNRFRGTYPQFLKAVRERAKANYAQTIRDRLLQHWHKGEYRAILDLLKEHHYVIENEGVLASVRGKCCARLGDYKAAVLFLSDAILKLPADAQLVVFSAAAPFPLLAKKQLEEAWEFAQKMLDTVPHSLTYLAASIVRFHQAVRAKGNAEKRRHFEEQLRLFAEAEKLFFQLPSSAQDRVDYRELMILGYLDTVVAQCNVGEVSAAETIFNRAVTFSPNDPLVEALRTSLNFPHPDAEEVGRQTIKLAQHFPQTHSVPDLSLDAIAA